MELKFLPVVEPPGVPAPSQRRVIPGWLGVDLISKDNKIELRQIGNKGGEKIMPKTKPEEVKSLILPMQFFVNIPFDSGFNAFVTRAWDPKHASNDPHDNLTMPLDATTTLEASIKRHSQCITLKKIYKNMRDGAER